VPKAIRAGLCYATEDRKTYGLVLINDIRQNIPLANLKGIANGIVVDNRREREVAQTYRKRMAIKSSGIDQKTVNLSGGNQQKVVLEQVALCRARHPDPRRADARHRCRRQIRDLHHHQRTGGGRQRPWS
jgi:ABC-type sugar transport system ATPase subunit